MGDRTGVVLIVLSSQAEEAEDIVEANGIDSQTTRKVFVKTGRHVDDILRDPGPDDTGIEIEVTKFDFSEVNYGNLDDLDTLRDHGIAFTAMWGPGDEYVAGEHYVRFDKDGELFESCGEDLDVLDFTDLLGILDKDGPVALAEFVRERERYREACNTWEDQEARGKLYRMKQAVLPKEN